MQYMLAVYETADDFALRNSPKAQAHFAAWMNYAKAMSEAGIMRGGSGLQPPSTASTVRLRNGKQQVQDGPFADTKEQLGGFFLIEVADLDAALAWAAKAPCAATGSVEIRACMQS